MRRLLVTLAIAAGCASETGGSGQGTTIIDTDLVVATIVNQKVGITVYKTNDFLMTGGDECKSLRGEITDSELITFKGYMADEAVKSLGRECGGGPDEYRITVGLGGQSVCWTTAQESPALTGLTEFFKSKAAMLAATPEGKCDGKLQDVGETTWKGAAGSRGSI
jgi:hypothetical protein